MRPCLQENGHTGEGGLQYVKGLTPYYNHPLAGLSNELIYLALERPRASFSNQNMTKTAVQRQFDYLLRRVLWLPFKARGYPKNR